MVLFVAMASSENPSSADNQQERLTFLSNTLTILGELSQEKRNQILQKFGDREWNRRNLDRMTSELREYGCNSQQCAAIRTAIFMRLTGIGLDKK